MSWLGEFEADIGEHESARSRHERGLAIREATLGPDHPLVAVTLNDLSIALLHLGDFGRAIALSERALRINEKVFGADHVNVAYSLSILAHLHYPAEAERARELYQRTLQPFAGWPFTCSWPSSPSS